MHRELSGDVSALKTYQHYIIGSPHTIYVYCNHKPIIYFWARKGNISARCFHFHLIISQFQNLKIIWTPGKNLALPDILSRNVTTTDMKKYQKKHKYIPKDIKFFLTTMEKKLNISLSTMMKDFLPMTSIQFFVRLVLSNDDFY